MVLEAVVSVPLTTPALVSVRVPFVIDAVKFATAEDLTKYSHNLIERTGLSRREMIERSSRWRFRRGAEKTVEQASKAHTTNEAK